MSRGSVRTGREPRRRNTLSEEPGGRLPDGPGGTRAAHAVLGAPPGTPLLARMEG